MTRVTEIQEEDDEHEPDGSDTVDVLEEEMTSVSLVFQRLLSMVIGTFLITNLKLK